MPNPIKDDPEFMPMGRPRCPRCQTRMITAAFSDRPEGFERRTFECLKCGHSELKIVTVGTIKSHTLAYSRREPKAMNPEE
jgi:transcription elongation factor Elf1